MPVGVATVKQGDFNEYIVGLGSVQALNTVSIKTRIDGQIMQVNFREGQDVRAGELLLVVDPRPYQVALDQAKANLAKDEAQLVNAKAQYDRNKVLYEQGVIAKQDLDTLEASFGTYEGTIARRQGGDRKCPAEPHLLLHQVSGRRSRRTAHG